MEEIEKQKMTYSDITKIQTNAPPHIKTFYLAVPQISNFDDKDIFNMILTNKIILKRCWNKVEKDEFRKLRSSPEKR